MARPASDRSPTVLAHELARAQRMADVFEDRVADPLMQGTSTMAHLILAVTLDVAAKRGFGNLTADRPRLAAWMRSITEFPSMQRNGSTLMRLLFPQSPPFDPVRPFKEQSI